MNDDMLDSPAHYERNGVECWQITRHMTYMLGNMCKYVFRHRLKGNPYVDLQKALRYARQLNAVDMGLLPMTDNTLVLVQHACLRVRDVSQTDAERRFWEMVLPVRMPDSYRSRVSDANPEAYLVALNGIVGEERP